MITSYSPAGSSSTMRCTRGSNTPKGSVTPGIRNAPPPPSDVQGHSDRTLAPPVPPDTAEARLLPGEGVAPAAAHRCGAGQELGVGPPVQRSGGRRLSLAAAGDRGRRWGGVGVPRGFRGRLERSRRRRTVPQGPRRGLRGHRGRGEVPGSQGSSRRGGGPRSPAGRDRSDRLLPRSQPSSGGAGRVAPRGTRAAGRTARRSQGPRWSASRPDARADVGHAPGRVRGSNRECVADQAFHRPGGAVQVRGSRGLLASQGRAALRHVRSRVHARRRSLHLRDAAPAVPNARPRATRDRRESARHRLQGREVRPRGGYRCRALARWRRPQARYRRHAPPSRRGRLRQPLSVIAMKPAPSRATLQEFVIYFLKVGTLGFGGPIALAGYMQRDLVDERGWIAPDDYKQGLALAQLAPGPLAAQLAIYLGWVRGRVLGATLVGIAFVAPSFLMVLALSALYLKFGGLAWMQALFYGIGAAVIAIIAWSAARLARTTLGRDQLLWGLFAVSLVVTAWTAREIIWVFVASGLIPLLVRARARPSVPSKALLVAPWPAWLTSGLTGAASVGVLWKVFAYFAAAGLFVFGSGLAIVPFLHGGVVEQFHWLTERQFLDAVAVSMITPGPVVITVAFIGYLVAGPLGATVAAIGVFAPVYFVTVLAAPHFHRFAENPRIKAFVDGVTAAATGAIAGAVLVLGRRALVDVPTVLICAATLGVITTVKRVPEPALIAASGVVGLLLKHAL